MTSLLHAMTSHRVQPCVGRPSPRAGTDRRGDGGHGQVPHTGRGLPVEAREGGEDPARLRGG